MKPCQSSTAVTRQSHRFGIETSRAGHFRGPDELTFKVIYPVVIGVNGSS